MPFLQNWGIVTYHVCYETKNSLGVALMSEAYPFF